MGKIMSREKTISYLERKGKIKGKTVFTEKEENEIKKVQKEGKIYGDPIVELKEN